ncbi:NAD(P)-binding protein [Acaromyces ingoldii]|uniref:NAD(P)-binding protein n=1 Tax=Acaromyces ingoldii TaxID=215250 RepID=A0A316YI91_9BASI|nr:NAD(P)-binding protein [Acaromyces ingoldii]PWN88892.1 NAD(P)-binding protein [Acaromyces ingoldii]
MDDKVCVVTGAAMGLGNVMARAFIESGASKLAILDLSAEKATAAADEAQRWFEDAYGGGGGAELDIVGVQCDVADEASVAAAMDDVHKRFGRIDVCVNSAGVVENFPAETYSTARMKWLYDINLNGSMYVAREAAKHMFADGNQGSIILVASMSGSIVNLPQPQAPYNASKAAVKHLASCLAVEWATRGVRVNSLSPGYMLTSLTRVMTETSSEGKKLREAWEAKTPMGRMGEPDDLKGAAVYLASDASRFTTGTDLIVDGGYCCP